MLGPSSRRTRWGDVSGPGIVPQEGPEVDGTFQETESSTSRNPS